MPPTAEHAHDAKVKQLAEATTGGRVGSIAPIEAGLGARRFFRVEIVGAMPRRLIARVDESEDETLRPHGIAPEPSLEPILHFYAEAGLPVPAHHGTSAAGDILLLEDVGDRSLQSIVSELDAAERFAYYESACALVSKIQALQRPPAGLAAFDRRLDDALFAYKAEQVIAWGLPWVRGRALRASEATAVRRAFARIAEVACEAPQRLAHRDFKAANLHVRGPADDPNALVMIDLQGAFLAPPEYDLVCLLQDFQAPLPDEEVERHLSRVRSELPDAPAPEVFARRFELLTLSRVGKDLSRFLYVERERGDQRNRHLLPNALRSLQRASRRAASDPVLAPLAELYDAEPPT